MVQRGRQGHWTGGVTPHLPAAQRCLHRTLIEFQCGWTGLGIGTAFATFLIIFVGSTLIGAPCVPRPPPPIPPIMSKS